jgi:hypothetical protein
MASVNEITDGGIHLQQFLTMGKNLKDSKAVAGFVKQVLSSPNVFVFGEVLELEGVKQVSAKNFKGFMNQFFDKDLYC